MRLQAIEDRELTDHFARIAEDGMDIFLLDDGNYRGALLHGTQLVNQMRANHGLGIIETLLLGHAYIAAGLLTSLVKGNDRIVLSIECDGPVRGITVDSNARGEVRGYLRNAPVPVREPVESFDLAPYIGGGTITMTRHLEMAKRPVSGHVAIEHGNLAKDLANFFVKSEQTPTAVSLSIQFDRRGRVTGAGGLFVQSMPNSDRSSGGAIEETIQGLPSIGSLFAEGETPAHIVHRHFRDYAPEMIGSRTVEFSCPCSKERYGRFLAALPSSEIADMYERGPFPVKVTCHNCNSTYMYSREEIGVISKIAQAGEKHVAEET